METAWPVYFDVLSSIAFAATGALVASRKQLDILGFVWLATLTGVGGGTFRDLILGLPVFWIVDSTPILICIATAILIHFIAPLMESRYRYILWFDAFGMAVVTVVGTATALAAGADALVSVVMGVITASLGGIIRDTLGQEPSIILRREIYVAAALVGSVTYVCADALGVAEVYTIGAGFGTAFVLRLMAMQFGWSLPGYRPRAGRKITDLPTDRR